MKGLKYGLTLGGMLVGLAGGSWLVFNSIQHETPFQPVTIPLPGRPATPRDSTATPSVVPRDSAPTPPVAVVESPVPTPAPAPAPTPPPSPAPWRPAPRDALRDSVFVLTRAGRDAEALRLMEAWLATQPDDHALRVEAARLRVRTGDAAGAWRDYERVLAGTADSLPVLAEYAAALLAAGAYPEAAARFGQLAAREPGEPAWRLGQARALAWDGQAREALALLQGAPEDAAGEVRALRRRLRDELELTSAEARAWMAESPGEPAARLALARALAREGRGPEAVAEYERLLAASADAALYEEAAGVAALGRDSVTAARLLGRSAALAPADTALQRRWADVLAWSGDRAGALAIMDRLVAQDATAERLRTRATLRSLLDDDAGALADLQRAVAIEPRAADYAAAGDLRRWSGDRAGARADYRRALALDPADAQARAGLAALRADAYRDLPWDPDEGLGLWATTIDDNDGFGNRTLRAGAGVALGAERRTVVSAAAEYRHVERDRPGFTGARTVDGWGGDVGLAIRLGRLRLAGRGGAIQFTGSETVPTWTASVDGPVASGTWRAAVSGGPAYETLRAGTTLGPGTGSDADVLTGVAAAGTLNLPLTPRFDLWSRLEALGLSDENARLNAQLALRYGFAPSLAALYSGGLIAFSDWAADYWSPRYYTLHSLGLEWRRRWPSGWFAAAQGLGGLAWYDETAPGGPELAGDTFQWSVGAEAGWQALRWDVGATATYGTDRSGDYQAFLTGLRVRYRW